MLDPTTKWCRKNHSTKWCYECGLGGLPPRPHSRHSPHPYSLIPSHFSHRWHPRPVRHHLPTDTVSFSCPLRAFLFSAFSASSSYVPLFFHPKKECPRRFSVTVSFLLHFLSLLIRAGIEPHPVPVQDPCSVCGSRVFTGWVAFLCMVCDQWCRRLCAAFFP